VVSGAIFLMALAIAIAGKICPPVPPPAIMILLAGVCNLFDVVISFIVSVISLKLF
jgi:hypothetical protein